MKIKGLVIAVCATVALVTAGCGTYQLLPPTVMVQPTITQYRYAYIIPTVSVTTSTTHIYSGPYTGTTGFGHSETMNPADVIAGNLMQRGYGILPELNDALLDQTIVVSYGEIIKPNGYSKEVILHFRDAKSGEMVCSGQADGGGTSAESIRNAILRCLDGIFAQAKPYFSE